MTAKCQPQENTSMTIDDDKKLAIKPVKHAVASGAGRVGSATNAANIYNFSAGEGLLFEMKSNDNRGTKQNGIWETKSNGIGRHLLGTPSQPVQVALLPPHTPHASTTRLAFTVKATELLRITLESPAVSAM